MKYYIAVFISIKVSILAFAQQTTWFKDGTSPTISCKENIKVVTQTGYFEISALQLLLDYTDDITESDQLILSIDKQYPVDTLLHRRHFFTDGKLANTIDYEKFKAYSWNSKTKNSSKRFHITDILNGIIELDVTVFDEAKNFSTCKVRIEVSYEATKNAEKTIND